MLPFRLKELVSSRAKSRHWSSDSSLEILHKMGDDKQPVAGALSFWPSQVSKDSPTGFWRIHVPTIVPCVTPVAWNGVNPWVRAICNYNTQFYYELNRKKNAKKKNYNFRGPQPPRRGLDQHWIHPRSSKLLESREKPGCAVPEEGRDCALGKVHISVRRDVQVSGWHGWSPFACLSSTGQNLLLLMREREEVQ